ncbi:MAG: succinate dehydrogenase iron-sulfur subunit [Xanthomonadales bacterium]|nr:succinate dehydrogenase iron-sulfur subunit [Xanthomonadales bacterium]
MNARSLRLEVLRYDPERDGEPRWQAYELEGAQDWTVLDALIHVKETLDPTLAFRWSCHMMVCGSCGMTVNGEPRLTCSTFIRDLPDELRIEPLAHFPIERDLVAVLDDPVAKLRDVHAWLVPDPEAPAPPDEHRQTPALLSVYKQYTMCINCMCCYAACPQYALDDDFLGPAALALAQRYNLDSRDHGRQQRLDLAADHDGAWMCSFVGACSEVCPKGVDPAAAIQQMKIDAAREWLARRVPGSKRR